MGVLATASLLAFIVQAANGYRIDYYNEGPDRQNKWFMVHEDNSAHSANHAYTRYPVTGKPPAKTTQQANSASTAQYDNIFDNFQKILTENRHINFDNPHTRPQKGAKDEHDVSQFNVNQDFYDGGNVYEEAYNGNIFSKGVKSAYNQNGGGGKGYGPNIFSKGTYQNEDGYNRNIFSKGYNYKQNEDDGYSQNIYSEEDEGAYNQKEERLKQGGKGFNPNTFYGENGGARSQNGEGYRGSTFSKENKDTFTQNEKSNIQNVFLKVNQGAKKEDGYKKNIFSEVNQDGYNRNIFSKGVSSYDEEGYSGHIFPKENGRENAQNVKGNSVNIFSKSHNQNLSGKNIFSNENKNSHSYNTFSTPTKSFSQIFDSEDRKNGDDDSTESNEMSYEDELRYNKQAEEAVESLYKKNVSDSEDSSQLPSNYIPYKIPLNQDADDASEVHYHQHKHMHNHKHTQDHQHRHEQDHIHAHVGKNQHAHKHQQEHKHEHDDKHNHAHKHLQQHKHGHSDAHKHNHAHKHGHQEEHKHAHREDHKHVNDHHHGHDHKHDHVGEDKHDHHHGHKHGHLDEHKHDHQHGHKHGHKHGNDHSHKHDHKHGHGNKHKHDHTHSHKKHH